MMRCFLFCQIWVKNGVKAMMQQILQSEILPFVGSKPLLQNLKDYKTADYENFADIKNFLSSYPSIQSKILSSEIGYVGDGLTSAELKFTPDYFYDFLKFMVENIAQHHYFCSPKEGWILLIAMEGYVEFGVLDKQAF